MAPNGVPPNKNAVSCQLTEIFSPKFQDLNVKEFAA